MPRFAIMYPATGESMPPEIKSRPLPPVPTGMPPAPASSLPLTSAAPFSLTSTRIICCGVCTSTERAGNASSNLPPISREISMEVSGYFLSPRCDSTLNVPFSGASDFAASKISSSDDDVSYPAESVCAPKTFFSAARMFSSSASLKSATMYLPLGRRKVCLYPFSARSMFTKNICSK